ncbi:hypothetical protein SODALDRAFT_354914 [Sodiomyces alkalinus F11]|uniref:Uncharacterized protein n=1 Tax=Sodiomyces alkalinus (strain CBS 110278 / VKM F-3762 / F11) TaxID=1314773 RepID=A0A3N2Q7H9_SODAK|nr:hypothetical protein SODALDRAFT_354914 [Sodiomyces alkalinus F11]ROT42731.1 hypothetical protein SODALDRAFT_354914 [Sodiomyces alkalinus F11]
MALRTVSMMHWHKTYWDDRLRPEQKLLRIRKKKSLHLKKNHRLKNPVPPTKKKDQNNLNKTTKGSNDLQQIRDIIT